MKVMAKTLIMTKTMTR